MSGWLSRRKGADIARNVRGARFIVVVLGSRDITTNPMYNNSTASIEILDILEILHEETDSSGPYAHLIQ